MNTAGTLTTLTLPTGVTLSSTRRPRFVVFGNHVMMINSPSRNLWIDPSDNTVRLMSIPRPASAPVLASGGAGNLTGAYKGKVSFLIKVNGKVMSESPLGPASTSVTLASNSLSVTGLPLSPDPGVNARRLYRTLAGGSIYFPEIDIDDNTTTTVLTDLTDAALQLLPAPLDLGTPPGTTGARLTLMVEWNGRLWAVGSEDIDILRFSADGKFYAWPSTNTIKIPPVGGDLFGITGFARRRDQLGVFRRTAIHQITGADETTIARQPVIEGVGCMASDSIVVIRDEAYFLGLDGVYKWGPQGVIPLSQGKVDPWFTTDDYFERAEFDQAVGKYNENLDQYELHLNNLNSADIDRWVSLDLTRGIWLGPHQTAAFTPTFGALLRDADEVALPVICSSNGFVYKMNQSTKSDTAASASGIDFDITIGPVSGAPAGLPSGTPDIMKMWLQPTVLHKNSGGNALFIPTIGDLAAGEGHAQLLDLSKDRTRLARLGAGHYAKLRIRENTAARDISIRGVELPYFELGRR